MSTKQKEEVLFMKIQCASTRFKGIGIRILPIINIALKDPLVRNAEPLIVQKDKPVVLLTEAASICGYEIVRKVKDSGVILAFEGYTLEESENVVRRYVAQWFADTAVMENANAVVNIVRNRPYLRRVSAKDSSDREYAYRVSYRGTLVVVRAL